LWNKTKAKPLSPVETIQSIQPKHLSQAVVKVSNPYDEIGSLSGDGHQLAVVTAKGETGLIKPGRGWIGLTIHNSYLHIAWRHTIKYQRETLTT
jgi:hypothetical protein